MTMDERRNLYRQLIREVLATMTPNVPGGRFSGQQVAYAKGRAGMRFAEIEKTWKR